MKKDMTLWFVILTVLFAGFTLGMLYGRNMRTDAVVIRPAESANTQTDDTSDAETTGAREWRININTASVEVLDYLPGVGPTLAQRIVEYREANGPFADIRELVRVEGIGEATLEKLRDYVIVED